MAGTVIVTGTPGAGKSTILQSIATDSRYKLVSVGTLMLEPMAKEGAASNRDEIRYKSAGKDYSKFRNYAFEKIAAMEGNVIVDTHVTIEAESTGRYVPGLPLESLSKIKNLKGFIYIDAHTDRILERRRTDSTGGGPCVDRHPEAHQHVGAVVLFVMFKYSCIRNIQ
jgi:adenylate kinase